MANDDTTSWTTPFGEQMDQRNAHLDALPGRLYRDWFEALNRASRVYGGNAAELDKHVQQFVGSPMFVSELPDTFGFEAARLLHNYLVSVTLDIPWMSEFGVAKPDVSGRTRASRQRLDRMPGGPGVDISSWGEENTGVG